MCFFVFRFLFFLSLYPLLFLRLPFSSEIDFYIYMMLTVCFICVMTMVDIGYRMSGGICMLLAYLIYAVFVLPRTGRPNIETRSLLDFQVCRRLQVVLSYLARPYDSFSLSLSPHDFHSPLAFRCLPGALVLPSHPAYRTDRRDATVGPRAGEYGGDGEFGQEFEGEERIAGYESVEWVDRVGCVYPLLFSALFLFLITCSLGSLSRFSSSGCPNIVPSSFGLPPAPAPARTNERTNSYLAALPARTLHHRQPHSHLRRMQTPDLFPHVLSALRIVEYKSRGPVLCLFLCGLGALGGC